jgi:putative acyl-CoA dehydrogenase
MAHHTRFDIVVGAAGMMRAALNEAAHHARHRMAFGKALADQPLMQNVIADLALEAEAAALLAFRLAAAVDASATDESERELQRVLTPVAKYWLCKRMAPLAVEAMECLGGNGYVEESPLARLYREAPLNGIWEGSANVICLDVLRALAKSPRARDALVMEASAAHDARIERTLDRARALLEGGVAAEPQARAIVESLALAMQASLMKRHSDAHAAEAFCASRLDSASGWALGTLAPGADVAALMKRAALEA